MKSMFRYGISAVAFAAATDAGATDYSKVRTHADLDAALGDRPQPEGWADFQANKKREWLTANPVPAPVPAKGGDAGADTTTAPEVVPGEGTTTVAEATAAATTEENPASTTRADDPDRDSTMSGTTTAENEAGITQEPNSNDAGLSNDDQHFDPPENEEQAAGNRHSHPAMTEAERTAAAAGADVDVSTILGGAMPAGEAADPANQPDSTGAADDGRAPPVGSDDVIEATRQAIGAGNGAPDGVGDNGADPSQDEVNALVDAANNDGTVDADAARKADAEDAGEGGEPAAVVGGKAKIWGLLAKGATRQELVDASGYKAAVETAYIMAQGAGRQLEVDKDEETGVKTYRLKPVEDSAASE